MHLRRMPKQASSLRAANRASEAGEMYTTGIARRVRRRLIVIVVAIVVAPLGAEFSFGQSFRCSDARTADEATICHTEALAKLDVRLASIYSDISEKLPAAQKHELANTQKDWLQARGRCGIDIACIRHLYEKRIEQVLAASTSSGRASKISVGAHAGDATILSLQATDTDHATVVFRRELDDLVEDCTRNLGLDGDGNVNARKVSDCVKTGMRRESGKVYRRRAMCSKSTIYTEFGNFTMVNTEKEAESVIDSKIHRAVRTDWKNHRNEEIVGNCSGCNTPQMLDTFKVMCPASYNAYFRGFEPY